MKLDLDGLIAATFFFGMLGLIEQAAAQILFNVSVGALAGTFATLMTAALGAAVARGASGASNDNGGDIHGQSEKKRPRGRGRGE